MTVKELYQALKKTGYDVAYREFKKEPSLPFIAYLEESRDNICADDGIYLKFKNMRIELYTAKKDTDAEEKLEKVLEDAGLIYSFTDVGKIESENLYETVYNVEI